jgi:hypothetical protein
MTVLAYIAGVAGYLVVGVVIAKIAIRTVFGADFDSDDVAAGLLVVLWPAVALLMMFFGLLMLAGHLVRGRR